MLVELIAFSVNVPNETVGVSSPVAEPSALVAESSADPRGLIFIGELLVPSATLIAGAVTSTVGASTVASGSMVGCGTATISPESLLRRFTTPKPAKNNTAPTITPVIKYFKTRPIFIQRPYQAYLFFMMVYSVNDTNNC